MKNKITKTKMCMLLAFIIFISACAYHAGNGILPAGSVGDAGIVRQTVLGQPDNKTCKAIGETDNYGFNMVFYNDGYEKTDVFRSASTYLITIMKNTVPFRQVGNINFFSIEKADDSVCRIVNTTSKREMVKCSLEINKYLKQCNLNNFRLVVLTKDKTFSYSVLTRYNSSLTVLPVESYPMDTLGTVFLHELGHLFGLVDEKATAMGPVSAESAANKPAKPNCAPDIKTAERWWGKYMNNSEVGYYTGCAGHATYIKPSKNSIMSNQGDSYGFVSEEYIKQVLECCYTENPEESCTDFYEEYPEFKACLRKNQRK